MDDEVEQYIEKQQSPQKEILKKVRNLILETIPDCNEKAAWGVVAFAGGKFYIAWKYLNRWVFDYYSLVPNPYSFCVNYTILD